MNKPRNSSSQLHEIDRETWNQFWPRVDFANMMQSWEYGDAKAAAEGWRPVRFLIADESGAPMALAQVLVRAWPLIGGIARLNRGPLLIDTGLDDPRRSEATLTALGVLLREARHRRWWLTFVAPELEANDFVAERLATLGLRRRKQAPWASARLSLLPTEETLLANLNGKWRNMLRKAQKSGLIVQHHEARANELERLLICYQAMQRDKGFSGVSESLLRQLAKQAGPMWRFDLYVANSTESSSFDRAGLLVSVRHGDTVTYLIGYTNDLGRKLNANYLLLWHSILASKNLGCYWFDMGGMNENTPKGIMSYKQGLCAIPYKTNGEFIYRLIA